MPKCLGIRLQAIQKIRHRSIETNLSAVLACARADIHKPVGIEHGLRVMLHDHDRISLVTQFLKRIDKFPVVTLVQADARLIQNIEDIDQFRTDLGGQTDSLAFTTRQRTCSAVERQVVKPYVQHKSRPLREFLQYIPGDDVLPVGKMRRQGGKPLGQCGHLHGSNLGNGLAVYLETVGLLIQPRPVTDRTDNLLVDVFHNSGEGNHLGKSPVAHTEKLVRAEHYQ